tara:strand:- start:329 stop:1555 length:1227 start_codon:yes stop_codon:yes gene_type:complete
MSGTHAPFVLPDAELDASLKASSITVLMVDDQAMIGEVVRGMVEGEDDIHFYFCQDPKDALNQAIAIEPTVILQDLVMPDVDGLTLVQEFRAHRKTRDVPLIVLSSREEPETKYKAFSLGANDYMVKFPDKLEVLARIRYHSKAYINKLERDNAFDALKASQASLRAELDEAERYVRSLLPESMDEASLAAESLLITSTTLGGDAFGYHWMDDDHFAIYLLDVCGHGVGAALLSVSAMNVLRAQTLPGVEFRDPVSVLAGLNKAFDMEKQNQMYFTIWYGVYDKSTRELKYSVGGHPPAILVPKQGNSYQKLKTQGMLIGAMPDENLFEGASVQVNQGDRLYIFSDGVYEVLRKGSEEMLQLEPFAEALVPSAERGQRKIDAMVSFVQAFQGDPKFEDDFSLLEITFK